MVRLRAAADNDCRLLWEWLNDPAVRAVAFESGTVPWEGHVAWFRRKIADPHCQMYVVLDEQDDPVGQVRFDIDPDRLAAVVTISVARERRRRGVGQEALRLACARLFADTETGQVVAYIRPHNLASLRMFEKAGFVRAGTERVKRHEAVRMTLGRPFPGARAGS